MKFAHIAKRATKNAAFPAMVDAALKERRLLRELAAKRVEMGLSQRAAAALMGTTQPALAFAWSAARLTPNSLL